MNRPNLSLQNRKGHTVAIVWVKNAKNLSPENNGYWMQELLDCNDSRSLRYLLMLSQYKGYLWRDVEPGRPIGEPLAEFPMTGVVQQYFAEYSDRHIDPFALELVVFQWLRDLSDRDTEQKDDAYLALKAAGLIDDIRDGDVSLEAAA